MTTTRDHPIDTRTIALREWKYVLDANGDPIPEPDTIAWAFWWVSHDRSIALTEIDGVTVSTIFLGLDLSHGMGPEPVLYETMIFGGPQDQYCTRYRSKADALLGHALAERLAHTDTRY